MLFDICIKFREYSLSGFSSYRADTNFVMNKVPTEITQKVLKAELPFLHSDTIWDRQTDAERKTICLPTLKGGRHNSTASVGHTY